MDPRPEDHESRGMAERINRLEELASFAEQRHDQLHGALLDLAARLDAVASRMARLDSRIESIAQRESDPIEGGRKEKQAPDTDRG